MYERLERGGAERGTVRAGGNDRLTLPDAAALAEEETVEDGATVATLLTDGFTGPGDDVVVVVEGLASASFSFIAPAPACCCC